MALRVIDQLFFTVADLRLQLGNAFLQVSARDRVCLGLHFEVPKPESIGSRVYYVRGNRRVRMGRGDINQPRPLDLNYAQDALQHSNVWRQTFNILGTIGVEVGT